MGGRGGVCVCGGGGVYVCIRLTLLSLSGYEQDWCGEREDTSRASSVERLVVDLENIFMLVIRWVDSLKV